MPDARINRGTAACEADTLPTELLDPVEVKRVSVRFRMFV